MVDTNRYLVGGPLNYGYGQPSGDTVLVPPWPSIITEWTCHFTTAQSGYILSIYIAPSGVVGANNGTTELLLDGVPADSVDWDNVYIWGKWNNPQFVSVGAHTVVIHTTGNPCTSYQVPGGAGLIPGTTDVALWVSACETTFETSFRTAMYIVFPGFPSRNHYDYSSIYGSFSGNTDQHIVNGFPMTPVLAVPNSGYVFDHWYEGTGNPMEVQRFGVDNIGGSGSMGYHVIESFTAIFIEAPPPPVVIIPSVVTETATGIS